MPALLPQAAGTPSSAHHAPSVPGSDPLAVSTAVREPRPISLREIEMQAILEGLKRNQGNKPRTAEELGISLKTLYNKLHQLADTQGTGSGDTAV
jgi:DNA-binding NtrC family response regulator